MLFRLSYSCRKILAKCLVRKKPRKRRQKAIVSERGLEPQQPVGTLQCQTEEGFTTRRSGTPSSRKGRAILQTDKLDPLLIISELASKNSWSVSSPCSVNPCVFAGCESELSISLILGVANRA